MYVPAIDTRHRQRYADAWEACDHNIRFETLPLREVNLSELAKTGYDTKHGKALSNKARTVPEVEKRLNDITSKGKECVVIEASDEFPSDIREFCRANASAYSSQNYRPTGLLPYKVTEEE